MKRQVSERRGDSSNLCGRVQVSLLFLVPFFCLCFELSLLNVAITTLILFKMQEKKLSILKNFSARFKKLVEESGITQTKIAKNLGVSPAQIVYYKTGKNMPGGIELYQISKLFGVSVDWLLTGEEKLSEDSATQMWRDRALIAEKKIDMMRGMLKKF